MARPSAGLCDDCRHQRLVRNTRGSAFSLCERALENPGYPRYPRLPVTVCAGHERRGPEAQAPRAEGSRAEGSRAEAPRADGGGRDEHGGWG